MTQVMTQSRNSYIPNLFVSDLKIWLILLKKFHLLSGEVARANTVLGSLVSCPREHLVAQTELLQILQPLELRSVDNPPTRHMLDYYF